MLAETLNLKICLVGPTGVGKTTLMFRLINDEFDPNIIPTLGANYNNLQLRSAHEKTKASLNIWDTAGQEAFRSIVPIYYANVDIFFLVYDLSNLESLEELKSWLVDIECRTDTKKSLKYLIGCKKDLTSPEDLLTSRKLSKAFSDSSGCSRNIETSSKSGEGVQILLDALAEDVDTLNIQTPYVVVQGLPKESKKCCK